MSRGPAPSAAVEFELTPEDWEDANIAHLRSSKLQTQAVSRMRTAFLTLFGALAALLAMSDASFSAMAIAFAGIGMAALTGTLHEQNLRRVVRKLGEDGVANGTFGPHRVEVTDEGLVNRTPSYEWLVRWGAVEEVRLEDGMFLIYIGPNAFMVIPESAFPDADTTRIFADAFYGRVVGAGSERSAQWAPAPVGGSSAGHETERIGEKERPLGEKEGPLGDEESLGEEERLSGPATDRLARPVRASGGA